MKRSYTQFVESNTPPPTIFNLPKTPKVEKPVNK